MAGNPSVRGAICYELESAFAEDVTTFATLRLPVVGAVDTTGLKHDKQDAQRVVQRRNDGTQPILMTQGGSVKMKFWLTGHGSATSGATSLSGMETFLGYVFGASAVSSSTGTTATGGTAAAPTTAAANGFTAGSLGRLGTLGDGRGGGQFFAVSSHSASTLNLLTAIGASPTNGDVVYSAATISVKEDPTTATTPSSIRLLLQTANLEYECHGCVATNVTFGGLAAAQVPYVEVTFSIAWWRYSIATFPSAVATETFQPAATATGIMFLNSVGTATYATRTVRDFSIDYKLGMEMLMGSGGIGTYQAIVGAARTPDAITVSWVEDADAATTTPVLPGYGTGTTAYHLLYTCNPTAQKAVGFYFPNLCVTNVATQMSQNNVNRLKITAQAYTGTTTTTDLTASAFRMGWA